MSPGTQFPAFLRFLDYFFLLRPTLWFPVFTILLGAGGGRNPGFHGDFTRVAIFYAICAFMGLVYLLNQLQDIETDRENKKLFFLSEDIIPLRNARRFSVFLIVSGTLCLLYSQNWILTLFIVSTVLLTGVLYSIGKGALKNSAFGSLAITFLGGVFVYQVGDILFSDGFIFHPLSLLVYACSFTAAGLMTMIPDIEGDRRSGKITFAVKYGAIGAARTALTLLLIALVFSVRIREWPVLIAAIISLPFFVAASFRENLSAVYGATKVSIFVLSFCIGIFYYREYLAVVLVYFVVARIYFRYRFGISYPSFSLNR